MTTATTTTTTERTQAGTTDAMSDWTPSYSPWRHGGWYVDNVRYPSGAVGCVSRNYPDKKWRIACDDRPFEERPTFPSRDAAARAEREIANNPELVGRAVTEVARQLRDRLEQWLNDEDADAEHLTRLIDIAASNLQLATRMIRP
jgi:hypothetical protein